MRDNNYLKLWGKTLEDNSMYPLVCHMLDVAAVTTLWLENDNILLNILIENSGLKGERSDIINLYSWLSALHDLGKATVCFQNKVPELAKNASVYDENRLKQKFDHGLYGLYLLSNYEKTSLIFASIVNGFEDKNIINVIISLFKASCWHHGNIPTISEVRSKALLCESERSSLYPIVQSLRDDLITELSNFFEIKNLSITHGGVFKHSLTRIFAGFVSVCDWIGSSDEVFRDNYSIDLGKHFQESSKRSLLALKKYGLLENNINERDKSFAQIFPFQPRGVQAKFEEILKNYKEPSLFIVEAPTGEGKSEAAFFAHYKFSNRGLYFALPSQATANQMYARVNKFYKDQMNKQIVPVLAHGFAWLNEDFKTQKYKAKDWDEASGYDSHDEWFFSKKKTLLATVGIGTIDQVMLSVLNTKHYFVKLFALAGKTLVIDEVHAYDYFMTPIIKQLLEWCSFLKINVILLSATMPSRMKKDLIAGYLIDRKNEFQFESKSDYPLITVANSHHSVEQYEVKSTRKNESITISLQKYSGNILPIIDELKEMINTGGNILWICNTVKRAQEVFALLTKNVEDIEIHLFHSRFTYNDRSNRENEIINLYGKGENNKVPNNNRPDRSILVATQVVEQSLDVDFDFIISDIAPIDLLLQRFGRMHRHEINNENRPLVFDKPQAYILIPESELEGPKENKNWDIPDDLKGFAEVYEPLIIYRTIKELSENNIIKLPDMYRSLVENVYSEEEITDKYIGNNDITVNKLVWENSYRQSEDLKKEMAKASKVFMTLSATNNILRALDITSVGDEDSEKTTGFIAKTRYGNNVDLNLIIAEIMNNEIKIGKKIVSLDNNYKDLLNFNFQKTLVQNSLKISGSSKYGFVSDVLGNKIDLLSKELGVWHAFQKELKKIPTLRTHHLLILDNNSIDIENYNIVYDSLTGLSINKLEEE